MNTEIWQKYLEKLADKKKEKFVLEILKIDLKHTPKAEEAMPYGVPGLRLKNKNLIAVAAHKNHLGIYPFSPKIVQSIAQHSAKVETSEGTLRYPLDDPPTTKEIQEIVSLRKKEID